MKDLPNRRAADSILLGGRLIAKKERCTLETELHEIVGNNLAPICWLLGRRRGTGRRIKVNGQSAVIALLKIFLFNQLPNGNPHRSGANAIPLGEGGQRKTLRA